MTTELVNGNYWLERVAREKRTVAPPKKARRIKLDLDDIWFIAGLLTIFALAMLWAWEPVLTYGISVIAHSIFWTVVWLTLCLIAFFSTH